MENVTIDATWAFVLAAASAIVLLANAGEKIVRAVKVARAPNARQDERLDAVEAKLKEIDRYLAADNRRLNALDEGNRVTQQALLALLAHGIDGNNVKQMVDAKEALQNHLINR